MYRFPQCWLAHSCSGPAPPSDPDSGRDPLAHDVEYMDARPDKEDMEEAFEHFLRRDKKKGA